MAAVGVIAGASTMLALMNLPANLMSDATLYLQIIGLCLLPEAAALCLAATLRAHGHTRQAMYVTLIVNLITFVGNLLLLYGWFGLPQLGVAGVAISTVAGRIVGVVLLVWLVARKTGIRLRLPEIVKPSRLMLGKVLHIGLPVPGENLSWMLQFMVVTAFVGLLGDKALATQSYFFQICLFILLFGLHRPWQRDHHRPPGRGSPLRAGLPPVAQKPEAGAHRHRLHRLAGGPQRSTIISLFTDDADIITQVAQLFLISLILEPYRTFNLVVINALRATGDACFRSTWHSSPCGDCRSTGLFPWYHAGLWTGRYLVGARLRRVGARSGHVLALAQSSLAKQNFVET